uniref:Uncharacterized protein n=1 Tax=Sphaerodactylus townsendi TaxID=933632 RepID=A0ACB8ESJ6_9SAUR
MSPKLFSLLPVRLCAYVPEHCQTKFVHSKLLLQKGLNWMLIFLDFLEDFQKPFWKKKSHKFIFLKNKQTQVILVIHSLSEDCDFASVKKKSEFILKNAHPLARCISPDNFC